MKINLVLTEITENYGAHGEMDRLESSYIKTESTVIDLCKRKTQVLSICGTNVLVGAHLHKYIFLYFHLTCQIETIFHF